MIADLFCGAGGWHVAMNQLGLEHHGYDNDPHALATYTAAGGHASKADLRHAQAQPVQAVVGSPPCQPYSAAGKKGGRDDARSRLALLVPAWAEVADWVALEQVTGASPIFARVAAMLTACGFKVARYTLHSECYGLPQTRTRLVLMAHRTATPPKPLPTHSRYYPHHPARMDKGVLPWVPMADALGWDGAVGFPRRNEDGEGYRDRDTFDTDRPAPSVTGKVRSWTLGDRVNAHGAIRTASTPAPTLTASMDNGNFRWAYARPATTVVGSFAPQVMAAPGWRTRGPRQDAPGSVPVTPAEAGVLQGFPADYPWQGSKTVVAQQIGNAIPPPLALAVITTLIGM